MSKLIITGMENGRISYVEGDEVVTSVEEIQEKVVDLRNRIAVAKSFNAQTVELEYSEKLTKISADFDEQSRKLAELKEVAIKEAAEEYKDKMSKIATEAEIELLEREEAKLSLVLGGLKARAAEEVEVEPEVTEEVKADDHVVTEVEPEVVEEHKEEQVVAEPPVAQVAAVQRPKRIIF